MVADPGDRAAAPAALPAAQADAAERRRARGRRREVGVHGRGEADRGRPQARPEPEDSRSTTRSTPGTVLKQTPAAGEEVEKGTPVAILVAVGSGNVNVPDITKKTASDADKALRDKKLTLGQASPTGADPKALIETQIPAPGEIVKQRHAGEHLLSRPDRRGQEDRRGEGEGQEGRQGRRRRRGGAARRRGRRTSRSRRSPSRPRRPTPRRRPTSASSRSSSSSSTTPSRTRCSHTKPGARHEGQEGRQGAAAGLGRPAAGGVHQREGHQARRRPQRRPARPGRRGPARKRRTRPTTPPARTSPTPRTAA